MPASDTPTPHTANVTIRELSSRADVDACLALQDDTWGHGFTERVPGAILTVAQKIGGVAAGAFDADDRMLGFVFGMTGVKDGQLVHWSDMLAVTPNARGAGLGDRLKHYQRERVQALGVTAMLWTADPLVARNAHFNINHLGAVPVEYVENMYGEHTGSALHGGLPTDRCVYRWEFGVAERGRVRLERAADDAIPAALSIDAAGAPTAADLPLATALRIHLPNDLEAIQRDSTDRALRWRLAVRIAFTAGFARGLSVTRFVRGTEHLLPYYVLTATR